MNSNNPIQNLAQSVSDTKTTDRTPVSHTPSFLKLSSPTFNAPGDSAAASLAQATSSNTSSSQRSSSIRNPQTHQQPLPQSHKPRKSGRLIHFLTSFPPTPPTAPTTPRMVHAAGEDTRYHQIQETPSLSWQGTILVLGKGPLEE